MNDDQRISLLSHRDQLERETWTKLQPYLSKYEVVWRMLVVPLRATGSIYLRSGIDEDLEAFAMNNYTAYVNMSRALDKIEKKADDLKYPEEIWANIQRAIEVAIIAAGAFKKVYRECARKEARIDTQKLEGVEESVKAYRNRLRFAIPATLTDEHGTRFISQRDKLNNYYHWTKAMSGHDLTDFVSVESELRKDFSRVCSLLQDLWAQIERLSVELLQNAEYQRITAAPVRLGGEGRYRFVDQDSSSGPTSTGMVSTSGSFTASDSPPSASDSLPSWFKSRHFPK